jgi:hypothetical protein
VVVAGLFPLPSQMITLLVRVVVFSWIHSGRRRLECLQSFMKCTLAKKFEVLSWFLNFPSTGRTCLCNEKVLSYGV